MQIREITWYLKCGSCLKAAGVCCCSAGVKWLCDRKTPSRRAGSLFRGGASDYTGCAGPSLHNYFKTSFVNSTIKKSMIQLHVVSLELFYSRPKGNKKIQNRLLDSLLPIFIWYSIPVLYFSSAITSVDNFPLNLRNKSVMVFCFEMVQIFNI